MAIYQLGDRSPHIAASAYVAPEATVIGDVTLGERASLWPGVVVRGDSESIHIGEGSNVQDGSVLHTDAGIRLTVGRNCTIGHMVVLHGCAIGDNSLVGIKSVVLNRAQIGRNCIVGANSLVTEGKCFPDGHLIMGTPAKVVRPLSPEEIDSLTRTAAHYVDNAKRYRAGLRSLRAT